MTKKTCQSCYWWLYPPPEGLCEADKHNIKTHKCSCWRDFPKDITVKITASNRKALHPPMIQLALVGMMFGKVKVEEV